MSDTRAKELDITPLAGSSRPPSRGSRRRSWGSARSPNGGAIALGHPFGMTGARITSSLVNALQVRDGQLGVEAMCVGGGMGMAMVVERLS